MLRILIFVLTATLACGSLLGCYESGKFAGKTKKEVQEIPDEMKEGYKEGEKEGY